MLHRWLISGLTVGLLASTLVAKQGIVTTRQGQVFKGDITEDDKYVFIDTPGGQLKIDKRNILPIDYAATLDDEYAARHAKLAANDVKGRIALSNWANDKQRTDLAIMALTEATKIDPTSRDAALSLQAAQRQMDLDQAAKNKKPTASAKVPTSTTPSATLPPAVPPATQPVSTTGPAQPSYARRLLNNDEINSIRQKEMSPDDPGIKVGFDNGVVKKYLATGDRDAKAFAQLSPIEQALEILSKGDIALAKDVRIVTDPAPLSEYKKKIQPLIASSCGSTACHGGTKSGSFGLYSGESTAAVYTNFYILQSFQTTIDGAKYMVIDREVPDRSLALQFGLPAALGVPSHPRVPNWKPRFRTASDPAYKDVFNWMSKSLAVLQPDYGIKVGVELPPMDPAVPAPGK